MLQLSAILHAYQNMTRRKNCGKSSQQNRTRHYSAKKKKHRRNNRKRKRAKKRIFPEPEIPDNAIRCHQKCPKNNAEPKRCRTFKPKHSFRNVYRHTDKTPKPSSLFKNLNDFILPFFVKTFRAFCCVNKVWNHNND